MDKVQLIKQEIERLKNHTLNIQKSMDGLITSVGRGRVEAFNDILKFIDSLPEEHNENLEEEIDRCWEGWIDPNPEVKGVDGYLSKDEFSTYACHFAEWQKQKSMQDFLEKAEMYLKTRVYYNMHPNNVTTAIQEFKNYIENESKD